MPDSLPCIGTGARTTFPPNTWPIAWWPRQTPNRGTCALAALRWIRRFMLLQGRLRSNEPTQIVACSAFGAVVGAMVAGLHQLVDWLHHIAFSISGDHSLSAGIGIDSDRILIVPALGGL